MKHQEIKQLLPEVFQRTDHQGSPLYGLLKVMEAQTEPAEQILQQIPDYFNPYITPEKYLPFLASWVDLDRFFPSFKNQALADNSALQTLGYGRLRELIVAAPQLSKLRGTAAGLQLFLETACGEKGFKIDENMMSENGDIIPFFIQVTAPETAEQHSILIERIIEQEKPAYVTYKLAFSPQERK
ncbi:MAG: phage tail protein [Methylococcaceae bacterium]